MYIEQMIEGAPVSGLLFTIQANWDKSTGFVELSFLICEIGITMANLKG